MCTFIVEPRRRPRVSETRLATAASVVRDDSVVPIPAVELVPGDLAVIRPGEPFPADGLVVVGTGLQVDESALTGEAYPVPKRPLGDLPKASGDPLVEEAHWVFAGTRLLTGEARVRVAYTGVETVYGEIVRSAIHGTHEVTPLQAAIGRLMRILIVAASLVCLALAAVRLYQGHGWLDALIARSRSPRRRSPRSSRSSLPSSSGSAVSLAKRQALVRRAVTVENIGRVSYLLGQDRNDHGRALAARTPAARRTLDADRLLFLASLAARGDSGDPMDEAIFGAAERRAIAAARPEKIETFPFTEDRKRESAILREDEGRLLVVTKGAAEVVLGMSTLDGAERAAWHGEIARLAEGAHKVIAVASREVDASSAGREPDAGFEFAGLLAFEDPVRAGSGKQSGSVSPRESTRSW